MNCFESENTQFGQRQIWRDDWNEKILSSYQTVAFIHHLYQWLTRKPVFTSNLLDTADPSDQHSASSPPLSLSCISCPDNGIFCRATLAFLDDIAL